MGLDMWVRRIKKPDIENRVYTSKELHSLVGSFMTEEEFEREGESFSQLTPYVEKVRVISEYYDIEKMAANYEMCNVHISAWTGTHITICGKDSAGNRVSRDISNDEVNEKFTIQKEEDAYAWDSEEIAYWRKHYDLQSDFYDLLGDVQNCGYYLLDAETIVEMKERWSEDMREVPIEDPTEESALFYHEWY